MILLALQKAFDTINHSDSQNKVFSGLGPNFVAEYLW